MGQARLLAGRMGRDDDRRQFGRRREKVLPSRPADHAQTVSGRDVSQIERGGAQTCRSPARPAPGLAAEVQWQMGRLRQLLAPGRTTEAAEQNEDGSRFAVEQRDDQSTLLDIQFPAQDRMARGRHRVSNLKTRIRDRRSLARRFSTPAEIRVRPRDAALPERLVLRGRVTDAVLRSGGQAGDGKFAQGDAAAGILWPLRQSRRLRFRSAARTLAALGSWRTPRDATLARVSYSVLLLRAGASEAGSGQAQNPERRAPLLSLRRERALRSRAHQPESRRRRNLPDLRADGRV